jgi:hypothetical protein
MKERNPSFARARTAGWDGCEAAPLQRRRHDLAGRPFLRQDALKPRPSCGIGDRSEDRSLRWARMARQCSPLKNLRKEFETHGGWGTIPMRRAGIWANRPLSSSAYGEERFLSAQPGARTPSIGKSRSAPFEMTGFVWGTRLPGKSPVQRREGTDVKSAATLRRLEFKWRVLL